MLLLHTKLPQNLITEDNVHFSFHNFCELVMWAQLSYVLCLQISDRLQLRYCLVVVISKFDFQVDNHVIIGGIQFLMGHWTEGFYYLLAIGQNLSSVSCHVGLSNMAICIINVCKSRRQ